MRIDHFAVTFRTGPLLSLWPEITTYMQGADAVFASRVSDKTLRESELTQVEFEALLRRVIVVDDIEWERDASTRESWFFAVKHLCPAARVSSSGVTIHVDESKYVSH